MRLSGTPHSQYSRMILIIPFLAIKKALKNGNKVIVLARDPSKMLVPEGSGGIAANTLLKDPNLSVLTGPLHIICI